MITYEEAIRELVRNRGIQSTEAIRLLGDAQLISQLIAGGDLSADPFAETVPTPVIVDPILPTLREVQMPGIDPRLVGNGGDPSGVNGSGGGGFHTGFIPGPGTVVGTNWPAFIRWGIDRFFGDPPGGDPLLPQGPLVLPPGSGTPGLWPPGGPQHPFPTARGGRVPFIMMPNGLPGCPSGYHPMKDGAPFCVRNRRMNPLNPRALSRATRRVGGFARAVKRARTIKKVCKSL